MSSIEAVEQFVGAHRGCGTLTPSTSSAGPGGYLLTLTCSCGKTFERWITPEEAESGPGAMPAPPPRPAPPPLRETPWPEPRAIDITPAASAGESLEDVMKLALDALETPKAPPRPPMPPALPVERPIEPPPRPEPVRGPGGESLEDVMKLALEAIEAPKAPPSPPAPPSAPPPPSPAPPSTPPTPKPAAAATPRVAEPPAAAARPVIPPPASPRRARREDAPKPDRGSLEDALRATLQALDTGADPGAEPAATSPLAPGSARPLPSRAAPAPSTGARGGRPAPDKQSLQDALRATLTALEAERKTAPPGSRPPSATPLRADPPARRKKKLSVKGAIGIVVLLAAAVGAGYGLRTIGQPPAPTAAPPTPPRVRVAENERAAVSQVMAVLRDVQSVSRTDVAYRVYFNRVSFAKSDVDRYLQNVKDADLRAALNDALTLHLLAANVWRAKTLNEREKWETVGEDPSVELCPGARRILAIGDEPANMSRAQWRGMALAAGVPLLWDCAAERLAEVERGLSK